MNKAFIAKIFCGLTAFSYLIVFAQAQAPLSAALKHRIENEVRSRYELPLAVEISVGEPMKPAILPGYDTIVVTLTGNGKTNSLDFLISQDRKTLARLEKIDVSQDLMAGINLTGRPVRGNVNGPLTIVSFVDYECPFCARMHATWFPALMKEYGNRIKFVYVDYPLEKIHPWAMHAAIDANCLAAQNPTAYWNFVDYIYANQKTVGGRSPAEASSNLDKAALDEGSRQQLNTAALNACLQKADVTAVKMSMVQGDKLGVDATPTTYVNGLRVSGVVPETEIRSVLDRALAGAGAEGAGTKP
jgi:protein-disulfide isomerase